MEEIISLILIMKTYLDNTPSCVKKLNNTWMNSHSMWSNNMLNIFHVISIPVTFTSPIFGWSAYVTKTSTFHIWKGPAKWIAQDLSTSIALSLYSPHLYKMICQSEDIYIWSIETKHSITVLNNQKSILSTNDVIRPLHSIFNYLAFSSNRLI